MSHFRGSVSGTSQTEASRLGTKASGIRSHTCGWNVGVRVNGYYDKQAEQSVFCIYATGGSDKAHLERLIAFVTSGPNGLDIEHVND